MTHGSVPSADAAIRVPGLARVEGEGGLEIHVRDGEVVEARLNIYEPPRFFEAFLRGRRHTEPPDITARICGICPIAYQMSACRAIEDACGVTVDGPIATLRRLIYLGEWIESHALHVYLLHAPDFLGYESAVHMAADHREVVERGLAMKKAGNRLMDVIGGRSVHPINVRVGGFYRAPTRDELRTVLEPLERAREIAVETARWVSGFAFPSFERDYGFVSLRHPTDYPITEGRVVSSDGLDIAIAEYDEHFVEEHVPHSTALHSRLRSTGNHYLVGPLARFNLNADRLRPLARRAAEEAEIADGCRNPFQSIVVRAVELVQACDEAIDMIGSYEPPDPPAVPVPPKAGAGTGATEAPRGLLYHRYVLDADGLIQDARIVPPTSQNQGTIEEDLVRFTDERLSLDREELTWQCEQAVRNHDPCISCATHFLDLRVVDA
ncbi:MAG TPA: Ni/Fe hydrogenase subunit alpha [Actinomycetota bacterium]